jgi:hypothetical protein
MTRIGCHEIVLEMISNLFMEVRCVLDVPLDCGLVFYFDFRLPFRRIVIRVRLFLLNRYVFCLGKIR